MIVLLAGIAVLVFVFGDFLQTTLGAQQAGRLTRNTTWVFWRTARALRQVSGRWIHRYTGPTIVGLTALVWILVHWLGWVLVHLSAEGSVVLEDGEPAGFVETIAYVGASISTLGASLGGPGGPWWDVVSALAAVNGMIVLTLSVTFVLNITQTVARGRDFAVLVHALDVEERYDTLWPRFAQVASQLNAFPIALYFSLPQPERRIVPAIHTFIDATLTNSDRLEAMRPVVATLPGICADGDLKTVKAEVDRWVRLHSLHPRFMRG